MAVMPLVLSTNCCLGLVWTWSCWPRSSMFYAAVVTKESKIGNEITEFRSRKKLKQ